MVRLSFCIPTYNFGPYIAETLSSILAQRQSNIEIVIVDGASTDETSETVRRFQRANPEIVYHQKDTNGGIDRDLCTAIQLAKGEYCWLLSADDLLVPGAVERVLQATNSKDDVYLCDRVLCTGAMRPIERQHWLSTKSNRTQFNLDNRDDLQQYLKDARSLGALFSYISSVIIQRSRFVESSYDGRLDGSAYALAYRLFARRPRPRVRYLPEALVLCRGNNDSFLTRGRVKRFLIDLEGYYRIFVDQFAEDSEIARSFTAVMRKEHRWYKWIRVRSELSESDWLAFVDHLRRFDYNKYLLSLAGVLGAIGIIAWIARGAWLIHKQVRQRTGSGAETSSGR